MMKIGMLPPETAESVAQCIHPKKDLIHDICKTRVRKGSTERYREMLCKLNNDNSFDPMFDATINTLSHLEGFYKAEEEAKQRKKREE